MFQTLKEGLKVTISTILRIKKVVRRFTLRLKKKIKKAFVLSFVLRLVAISLPTIALPAFAQYHPEQSIKVEVGLTLAKNATVFEDKTSIIEIKPGDSNNTIAENKKREEEAKAAADAEAARQEQARQQAMESQTISNPSPSLDDLRTMYKEAGNQYGVPWELIEAVHQVESGKSGDTSRRSYAGAVGPMQFMPSTFRKYGDGGSITSVHDSIFAAARLLSAAHTDGASWSTALRSYNNSTYYVNMVLSVADSIGAGI